MIAACWAEIQSKTLRLSWKKMFPLDTQDATIEEQPAVEEQPGVEEQPAVEEFQPFFQALGQEVDEGEISEWLQSDNGDRGYEHLSDTEIITEVTSEHIHDNSDDEIDDPTEEEGPIPTPNSITHTEAVTMFDSCINWLQSQSEANPHNLSVLRSLREIAEKKRLSTLRQRVLTDFYTV